MIEYNVIATGSTGNAVVLDQFLMIDCGVAFKKLAPIYQGLKLVLLTHIHGDHFNPTTIKKLAKERPTLRWGCGSFLVANLVDCGVSKKNIDVLECGKMYDYKVVKIIPVELVHNVPNQGYKLHWNDYKIIYATDTNSVAHIQAKNYDLYMIEANYFEDEIKRKIATKIANGEYSYEKEVVKNHLSYEKCNDFIYSNKGPKSEIVYLHFHVEKGSKNDK